MEIEESSILDIKLQIYSSIVYSYIEVQSIKVLPNYSEAKLSILYGSLNMCILLACSYYQLTKIKSSYLIELLYAVSSFVQLDKIHTGLPLFIPGHGGVPLQVFYLPMNN